MRSIRRAAFALLIVTTISAAGWSAAVAKAAGTTSYRYFEHQASFTQGPSSIEFTSLDYRGDDNHHATQWSATDHFMCTFDKGDVPRCSGQIAIGPSMLLVNGTGGQGDFDVPITAGTGRFAGARGVLHVHNVGTTQDSDLVITLA